MKISSKDWKNYIARLRKINEKAAGKVADYMRSHDCSTPEGMKALVDYAHAVATKYGEGSAELSCQMLDAVAEASGVFVPAAEPAATATYGEIAKTIYGTMASTKDPDAVGAAVGRSVKLASVDTLQQNALRDGAEWAWIPAGDTCPFCLMLASRGWEYASKKAIKNGHADHIHNNCDCTYCVRFDHETSVEGYDPDALYDMYHDQKGIDQSIIDKAVKDGIDPKTTEGRMAIMRRAHYAANRDHINAQKRAIYARENGIVRYEGIPKNWERITEDLGDELLAGVNPNYTEFLPDYLIGTRDDYSNNCVNCVVAYDARKKGHYVTACSVGENHRLQTKMFTAWVGREPSETIGSGLDNILEFMDGKKDGTRVAISVKFHKHPYISNSDGHAFIAERINGETVFLDPQKGKKIGTDIFERVIKNDTLYMQIDDLDISDRGVTACKRIVRG